MTAYGSGTCDPLPWKLTLKHRGGISKILIPPSLREHGVSMENKRQVGKKALVEEVDRRQEISENP